MGYNGHTEALKPTAKISKHPNKTLISLDVDKIAIAHTAIDVCRYDHHFEVLLTYAAKEEPFKTCKIKIYGGSYVAVEGNDSTLKNVNITILERNGLPCEVRNKTLYLGPAAK